MFRGCTPPLTAGGDEVCNSLVGENSYGECTSVGCYLGVYVLKGESRIVTSSASKGCRGEHACKNISSHKKIAGRSGAYRSISCNLAPPHRSFCIRY